MSLHDDVAMMTDLHRRYEAYRTLVNGRDTLDRASRYEARVKRPTDDETSAYPTLARALNAADWHGIR